MPRTLLSAVFAVVALCACGSDKPPVEEPPVSHRLEIATSAGAGEGAAALAEVVAIYQSVYPDDTVTQTVEWRDEGDHAAGAYPTSAAANLLARLASGEGPDVVQIPVAGIGMKNGIFGAAAWPADYTTGWVDFLLPTAAPGTASSNLLSPLDDVLRPWLGVLKPEVLEQAVSPLDGKTYVLPVAVHRLNALFYNAHVLEGCGITPPDAELWTWQDFFALATALELCGQRPLARLNEPGALVPLVQAVLIGTDNLRAGNFFSLYGALELACDDSAANEFLEAAAGVLYRLVPLIPHDPLATAEEVFTRADARAELASGAAALLFDELDYKRELEAAGLVLGEDFGVIVPPGNHGFVHGRVDGYAMTSVAKDRERALELLKLFASPLAQVNASLASGALPVRSIATDERFDAAQVSMIEELHAPSTRFFPESGRYTLGDGASLFTVFGTAGDEATRTQAFIDAVTGRCALDKAALPSW